MLTDLSPRHLVQVAKELDADPLDLVRVLSRKNRMQGPVQLSAEDVAAVRAEGGFAPIWIDQASLPDDSDSVRQHIRAALQWLLEQDVDGSEGTRIDNLWRGMDDACREGIRASIFFLAEQEVVSLMMHPLGLRVAVSNSGQARVKALVDGADDDELWTAYREEG